MTRLPNFAGRTGRCSVRFCATVAPGAAGRPSQTGCAGPDGTKLEANATKRKTLTYEQVLAAELARLDDQVGELLAAAETADQQGEDGQVHLPAALV